MRVGGLWNVNLGYSCQPVKDAIAAQLDRLPYYSIFRGTSNDCVIELAEELRAFFAPDGLSAGLLHLGRVGQRGNRAAAGAAVPQDPGRAGAGEVPEPEEGLSRHAFRRRSVNGNANFRTQYEPLLPGCHHIPRPIPIATRSTKPTRRGWRSCALPRWRTRSRFRAPAPSPPSSWSRCWARAG
jgi:hypothetical protein